MSSPSTQLASFGGMSIYEPLTHISPWRDAFRGEDEDDVRMISSPTIQVDVLDNKSEYVTGDLVESSRSDQDSPKLTDKVQRRLAQNREAARKSRMRKKAYVQQLESSRLKLAQLEQELEKARQQGMLIGSASDSFQTGFAGVGNAGTAAFELEYSHWVEEQHRQTSDLRTALHTHIGEMELRVLVDNGLSHYNNLFRMKAEAAKADIFHLISGKWRTSAERFFLWIGGFRPSELINVLVPQLDPLTEQQLGSIHHLQQCAQQAEDALSQGIDKLQHILAQTIATDLVGAPSYRPQVAAAIDKLEALEGFVSQADHLRQQTLQQMSRILTTRQAARALLAMGEYFHRLRALSSLWSTRPREST